MKLVMKWEELNQKYPHAMQDLMNWMTRGYSKNPEPEKIFVKTHYGFAVNVLRKQSEQDEGVLVTPAKWEDADNSDRNLYDFFDYKELYIVIVLRGIDRKGVNSWVYDIRNPQLDLLAYTPHWESFPNRWLAEAKAFEKAFELLEKTHE